MGKKDRKLKRVPGAETVPSVSRTSLETFASRPILVFLLLAVLGGIVYSHTFSVPFHFDDRPNIVHNPRVKDLTHFSDFSGTRYVGYFTFALNYHFGGLQVFGYHLVNLAIHVFSAFLVYCLVSYLGRQAPNGASTSFRGTALAAALLFVCHPVQTQAVTYIVQRFASLVALFYLVAVVCYLKWRLGALGRWQRWCWYVAALLSTALAMKTKENSFTLPLVIVVLEGMFFGTLRPSWSWFAENRRRLASLVPFLLTMAIIPLSRPDLLVPEKGLGFASAAEVGASRWEYLFTEFRVIVTYLRLLVLPVGQNLGYDYPRYATFFEPVVFVSFLLHVSVIALAFGFLGRAKAVETDSPGRAHGLRLISFGIVWFYLTLSVESSFIPIQDIIFEHRIYLPSAGFFLAVVLILSFVLDRLFRARPRLSGISAGAVLIVSVMVLSACAYRRNQVWKDEITLWSDVVEKSPRHAKARHNLGEACATQGRYEEAMGHYEASLRLDPNSVDTVHNLANVHVAQGRLEKAERLYEEALRRKPTFAYGHFGLGNIHLARENLDAARGAFEKAVELKPDFAQARVNLGHVYGRLGRLEDAVRELEQAVRLAPELPEAHLNLGNAYANLRRFPESVKAYERVLELKPDHAEAKTNLEIVKREIARSEVNREGGNGRR